MHLSLKEVVLAIIYIFVVSYGHPVNSKASAVIYLYKFGYLQESDIAAYLKKPNVENVETAEDLALTEATKNFQKFFGLKETGQPDAGTLTMMNKPRCGVKDRIGNSKSVRSKRHALQGHKWRVQLTYRITKYPAGIDKAEVASEIARAAKVWNDATTIQLKKAAEGPVDINIRFENKEHSDGHPFDGPEHELAHSFFPNFGGYIHFDNDENWTVNSSTGINLFQIAAHEFGHALGLAHSDEKKAIMYPVYEKYNPDFKIHSDDIEGIETLYGSQHKFVNPVSKDEDEEDTSEFVDSVPDLCKNAAFDTINRNKNGITYIFKGDYYWKYVGDMVDDDYPRKISEDWDGLEGNLDASFTLKNGSTYFFKGNHYWRFKNKKMDAGYPKVIGCTEFQGIPPNLDAALVWNGDGKVYFFKGDKYWRYDFDSKSPVSKDYPASIKGSHWKDLPSDGINAAVSWEKNLSYFFTGKKYYQFDDVKSKVTTGADLYGNPPYPRPIAKWWFKC